MNSQLGKQSLERVSLEIGDAVDVFICSASFEDRCLSIPLQVRQEKIRCAVIVKNRNIREVEKNAEQLCSYFGKKGQLVGVDTGQPLSSADAMYHCLSKLILDSQLKRVAVDITTFTHEQLLILLGILERLGLVTILCLYSGAAAYMTSTSQWLSEGIAEIRSVLGFSGDLGIAARSKLVMLVGFEWERARRLIDAYDPTSLALGLGRQKDAIEEEHYRMNRKYFEQLVKYYPESSRFEFSCNDAMATAQIIGEQCEGDELAPVVAPLNTKISTVGAALAAFRNRRIQLCYAQAAVYNCVSYSKPGRFFRAFQIDLLSEH